MNRDQSFVSSQRGGINYVNMILLLIVTAIALFVFVYGKGWFQVYNLTHFAEGQAIKASEISDQEMHNQIYEKAAELGIDMGEFTMSLERYDQKIFVSFEFQRAIPFITGKSVTFKKKIEKSYGDIDHL
jgi:hypothetical protein